jgi:hypothetical protein
VVLLESSFTVLLETCLKQPIALPAPGFSRSGGCEPTAVIHRDGGGAPLSYVCPSGLSPMSAAGRWRLHGPYCLLVTRLPVESVTGHHPASNSPG